VAQKHCDEMQRLKDEEKEFEHLHQQRLAELESSLASALKLSEEKQHENDMMLDVATLKNLEDSKQERQLVGDLYLREDALLKEIKEYERIL